MRLQHIVIATLVALLVFAGPASALATVCVAHAPAATGGAMKGCAAGNHGSPAVARRGSRVAPATPGCCPGAPAAWVCCADRSAQLPARAESLVRSLHAEGLSTGVAVEGSGAVLRYAATLERSLEITASPPPLYRLHAALLL